ncbi:tyrosine-protein phosphatase [Micromonospora thermarum]|uniref:Tyrosine-protein phosphatase n=1 Tax=Micromonospora thermarum TaxID=2720024 RepID=A0ABX0Z2S7_9ACTN|nr:tyrosine-protein phosphatase [Micromonospora thermarum]NJP31783.1 tyrosine-protein phosphatase [Micromonospora thermarum]
MIVDDAAGVLTWPGCRNVRDLGGTPTTDGRRIRHGALLRSDRLTPADVPAARAAGVSRIVDLRWARECERDPSPFASDPVYRNAPLLADPLGYNPPEDSYGPMLDHNAERMAVAVRLVADAPPGAVLVHCHAGRDRTGVLVALLLGLAGVGPAEIAADFARTEGCGPLPMRNTLTHLDAHYGGSAGYLTAAGLDPALLAAVRSRLLPRAGPPGQAGPRQNTTST